MLCVPRHTKNNLLTQTQNQTSRSCLFWAGCHCNHGLLSVFKIRWVLEDQIVSALLHSGAVASATLHKVAAHIVHSSGRPHCHSEDVPLQFVFGPEQSLEKFREANEPDLIVLVMG